MKQKHILGWVLFILSAVAFFLAALLYQPGTHSTVTPAFSVLGVFLLVGSFLAAVPWRDF